MEMVDVLDSNSSFCRFESYWGYKICQDARVVENGWSAKPLEKSHVGSNPTPDSKCGNSSVGRARPCQGRGREFESRFPLSINNRVCGEIGRHVSLRG